MTTEKDPAGRGQEQSGSEAPAWLAGFPSSEAADRFLELWRSKDNHQNGADQDVYGEILKEAIGVDPVLAVADGRADLIPGSGWLVKSHVSPGHGGVIKVTRYGEGGFVPETCHDSREQYSSARLYYRLKSGNYLDREIAYENPDYPGKETEPCDRTDLSTYVPMRFEDAETRPLDNGGRIIARSELWAGGNSFAPMDWQLPYDARSLVNVNRVVSEAAEVEAIVGQIGAGMGLEPNDVQSLVAESTSKFARSGLNPSFEAQV